MQVLRGEVNRSSQKKLLAQLCMTRPRSLTMEQLNHRSSTRSLTLRIKTLATSCAPQIAAQALAATRKSAVVTKIYLNNALRLILARSVRLPMLVHGPQSA